MTHPRLSLSLLLLAASGPPAPDDFDRKIKAAVDGVNFEFVGER